MGKTGWHLNGDGSWTFAPKGETLALIENTEADDTRTAYLWEEGHGIARRKVVFNGGWTLDEIKRVIGQEAVR